MSILYLYIISVAISWKLIGTKQGPYLNLGHLTLKEGIFADITFWCVICLYFFIFDAVSVFKIPFKSKKKYIQSDDENVLSFCNVKYNQGKRILFIHFAN